MENRIQRPSARIITRRSFSTQVSMAGAILTLPGLQTDQPSRESPVALVRSSDRRAAIDTVIQSLGGLDCQGKDVYLKCNYNSADPFPATTHPDTLTALVEWLKKSQPARITLVERSGMGVTRQIWQKLGVADLAKRLGIVLLALEDLPRTDWLLMPLRGSHWKKGVEIPHFLHRDVFLIQVSNLKTHRFGGQFSASLKNSIGLMAKHSVSFPGHNFMAELHTSPDQRLMIAEVNQLYSPSMALMDASEIFINGGPERGERATPHAIAASKDRVALDAVGVAILKIHGAIPFLGRTAIFEYEQIKRAAELKLGVNSSEEIKLLTGDTASANLGLQVRAMLSITPEEKKT